MSKETSIGRGPAHGSNENHDGDARNTTMGESVSQDEPPVGNALLNEAAPDVPADVPGKSTPSGHGKDSESSKG